MIIFSLVVGFITGRFDFITQSIICGSEKAIKLCLTLFGIMCFWGGIAKIGEKSGLVDVFAIFLQPFMKILFPKFKKNSPVSKAIVASMIANFFGLGNAATPLGIKAMKELAKVNNLKSASNEMCMFVVMNIVSFQFLPITIIGLRQSFGSRNPGIVILPIWLISFITLISGIIFTKLLESK
ncbi:MAG: nucleoside recognition protein [Clostridiales bacterium]|jgi:spore maturation protein A|nr:nucleoside recognition protein [Clostridiales bacterium]